MHSPKIRWRKRKRILLLSYVGSVGESWLAARKERRKSESRILGIGSFVGYEFAKKTIGDHEVFQCQIWMFRCSWWLFYLRGKDKEEGIRYRLGGAGRVKQICMNHLWIVRCLDGDDFDVRDHDGYLMGRKWSWRLFSPKIELDAVSVATRVVRVVEPAWARMRLMDYLLRGCRSCRTIC